MKTPYACQEPPMDTETRLPRFGLVASAVLPALAARPWPPLDAVLRLAADEPALPAAAPAGGGRRP